MTIFLVSREVRGLAEAGGVKDVVREMAETWNRLGHRAMVLLPLYGFLRDRLDPGEPVYRGTLQFQTAMGFQVYHITHQGVEVLLFELPPFMEKRAVYTYTPEEEKLNPYHQKGTGHRDSGLMNLSFQRAVADYLLQLPCRPDALHCHDGHTAWIPVLLKTVPRYRDGLSQLKTLVTIHNAGVGYHQELQDWDPVAQFLGLEPQVLETCRLGSTFDPLAGAGLYSRVNTVSPFYAEEIMDPANQDSVGHLGNFYRERGIRLPGIFNGMDPRGKDPLAPQESGLPGGFSPGNPGEGKLLCRRTLAARLVYPRERIHGSLDRSEGTVLFSMQSRLTGQKGIEKLINILPTLLPRKSLSFVIMGEGESRFETQLAALADAWEPEGRFAFINTYEESYSPLVFAAGDFFLIPSLYEPCGLTDLKALLMGNLPIVHGVGGLKKITDHETGLVISDLEGGLEGAVLEAERMVRETPEAVLQMQARGYRMVKESFSWDRVLMESYIKFWMT